MDDERATHYPGHPLFSAHRWKARLLLWAAAAGVGGAAVGFAWIADFSVSTFQRLSGHFLWWPWLAAPIGFFGIAWLTRRFFSGAEGSGIPQTMFAAQSVAGETGLRLLRPHIVIGRVVLAGSGLLCGASIGREGPTVHVGAVIAHSVGRWMPHGTAEAQRRALILAGGAAGVAAAFNAPLAGIVFAIEELSKSFEERASGATLTAVVLAGIVAIAMVGDYTYFGQPPVVAVVRALGPTTLAVAITGGLAGGLFSRATLAAVRGFPGALGRLQREHPALFAALCGLSIAAIGALCGGLTYGSGYQEARSVLVGNAHLSWTYAPARAVATLLSYLSGIPAGILAPSLSVGAGLGQFIADQFGQSSAVPFAILGMCGYLAGVTQAPLTSLVIVMEMTAQHQMVFPLMVTAAIATGVAKVLSPPLYQTLAQRYVAVNAARDGNGRITHEEP
jgi:H+/Cl- antiporter ClcA